MRASNSVYGVNAKPVEIRSLHDVPLGCHNILVSAEILWRKRYGLNRKLKIWINKFVVFHRGYWFFFILSRRVIAPGSGNCLAHLSLAAVLKFAWMILVK